MNATANEIHLCRLCGHMTERPLPPDRPGDRHPEADAALAARRRVALSLAERAYNAHPPCRPCGEEIDLYA